MTDETQEQQITAVGNEMSASFLAAKKRSNATLAKLEEHPEKFTMLTGDRPTGRLHLGHYFGSIRERVAMQNRGVNSNIIIADYQVITDRDTTEHIEDNVLNLVLDYMAAGIDPNKTMIFTHSAVPAENQLMLPFLSLVTEAELHRNPTVKSEMEASGHALTGLLLTYPVHQACDILFCKANVVPIGKDNLPHVEITRTIARRFNERYAKKNPVFPEPSAILSEAPEIPGLDGRKMSKSYNNVIPLFEGGEKALREALSRVVTDSKMPGEPKDPAGTALTQLYDAFADAGEREVFRNLLTSGMGWGDAKNYVADRIESEIGPMREKYAYYTSHPDILEEILQAGAAKARRISTPFMENLREAVGLRRFHAVKPVEKKAAAKKAQLPVFKQYREKDGKFYFKLTAADGTLLVTSAAFDDGKSAGMAIGALKKGDLSVLETASYAEGATVDAVKTALAQLKAAAEEK